MTKTNTRGARIPDFIIPLIEGAVKREVTNWCRDARIVDKVTDLVLGGLATKEGLDWYFCAKRLTGIRHSSLCYSLAETAVTKCRYGLEFRINWWAQDYVKRVYDGGERHRMHGFIVGGKDAKDYERKLYAFMKWSGLSDDLNYKGEESLSEFFGNRSKYIEHSHDEAVAFWDEYKKNNTSFS